MTRETAAVYDGPVPVRTAHTPTREELERARQQGWPVHVAARELGSSAWLVRKACTEHGITLARGVPNAREDLSDEAVRDAYQQVAAGESVRSAARALSVPEATLRARLHALAKAEGLPWPPVPSVGQRCYQAYLRLRAWDAVAAEVLPDSTGKAPGQLAQVAARRWATGIDPETGQARAGWPVPAGD